MGVLSKGINSEFGREEICSLRLTCSGDPQSGWLYGGGPPGLIGPHPYLVQRMGGVLGTTLCGLMYGERPEQRNSPTVRLQTI